MTQGNLHQRKVFEYLKTLVPEGRSLAEELCDVLYLSTDSVYRRIRGDTPLTLDELKILCDRFSISADQLLELKHPNRVVFDTVQISSSSMSLKQYLERVNLQLGVLLAEGNCEIIYCSKDLPLFHFFAVPELMAFKFHFWQQVIAQDPAFKDKPFDPGSVDEEARDLCGRVLQIYNQIPSIEIWNAESFNTTLFQMAYFRKMGIIQTDEILFSMFDLMGETIAHLEVEAETGTKFLPGQNPEYQHRNFQLFYNQIALADTIILARSKVRKTALINYGILNYVTTEDTWFADSLESDLQNVIRRSTKLSESNERQRGKFFGTLNVNLQEHRDAFKVRPI